MSCLLQGPSTSARPTTVADAVFDVFGLLRDAPLHPSPLRGAGGGRTLVAVPALRLGRRRALGPLGAHPASRQQRLRAGGGGCERAVARWPLVCDGRAAMEPEVEQCADAGRLATPRHARPRGGVGVLLGSGFLLMSGRFVSSLAAAAQEGVHGAMRKRFGQYSVVNSGGELATCRRPDP